MDLDAIFKDLVVVELASVLAGPAVGMFFAELGARVIKIENKKSDGDITRSWKHATEDEHSKTSAYYHTVNYNKEAFFLNLGEDIDRTRAIEFIKEADVLVSNFKPGSASKISMDYDSLSDLNDRLIYASISAYGSDDPRPGFDALIQAETGWMFMNGEADGPPVKLPVALMDIMAGHQLKEGVLVALLQRAKTGKGCHIDVSLYDTAIASLANQASNYLNLDVVPKRKGSQHPNIAPYGDVVSTSDGVYFMVAAGNNQQFNSLCGIMGRSDMAQDERFVTNLQRVKFRTELFSLMQAEIRKMTAAKFESDCNAHHVPVGRINDLSTVFEDPKAQQLILENLTEEGAIARRVRSTIFKTG